MTDNIRGIALKVTAVSIFTFMMALIKATSQEVPTGQQVFFRAFFTLLVVIGWLSIRGDFPKALRTSNILDHTWRGLAGAASMSLRFFALGVLSFPEVAALGFTTPLILTVLAALILGETVRAFRLTTVALGFVGVLIVLWPTLNMDGARSTIEVIGATAILGSTALAALAQIFVRRMVATEGTAQIVFYFSLLITVLSLFTLPFGWVKPSVEATAMLVTAGVIGGIGQICLTAAYRNAPASVVAPFDYTSMLLALALAYFWFSEIPTAWTITGALVIITSGVVILWREQRLGRNRNRAQSPL
ncbi:DMT family transporter [uncultured Planktomarina sp.]|jgi:drug/metabolite transporter (DMT)-like permease|uniref:DMT family transporter n=1 Tax=uncultured Planktomarina sp. TaxID=1538529 RepID=UPI003261A391